MNPGIVPQYKKFSEQGYYILNDNLLMSFSHFDGLTERQLSIDLLVDNHFRLALYYGSFRLGMNYNKGGGGFHFEQTMEEPPPEILSFIKTIREQKDFTLKDHYSVDDYVVEDMPGQLYLFNFPSGTKAVNISGMMPLKEEHFKTPLEKKFLTFHLFVKEWTNKIFENYISGYRPGT